MLFNEKDPEKEKMDKFAASCKPLKELLDSVRDIEGFPLGNDEDILALSDAPLYTACPNPYISDFLEAFGEPYDEDTDTYDRKPFVSDVSEGKNDPIYNAHTYHTKVPHKAIMPFIEHYTVKGDIVFDGFCGTGMTGVAAQLLNRRAILCDLSPAATFIASNYNRTLDVRKFESKAKRILKEVENECGWMYETLHTDGHTKGRINYTVWSEVFICPYCKNEYTFWDEAIDKETGKVRDEYSCTHCNSKIKKSDCGRATNTFLDPAINQEVSQAKQVPVLTSYSIGKKRYEKVPDYFDFELINKIESFAIPYNFPLNSIPIGDKTGEPLRVGITHIHHFYTKRNLWTLACINSKTDSNFLKFWRTSIDHGLSKRVKHGNWSFPMSTLSGTLYLPALSRENNPLYFYQNKLTKLAKAFDRNSTGNVMISTQSSTKLKNINTNTIDYIFVDPPFGSNLMYSELNFLLESWLQLFTNNDSEAIINNSQRKGLEEYKELMLYCFKEMYQILKPNRWITVEFHNSKASVWNAIQGALTKAGFIIAQVTILDKKQGSFNQVGAFGAVKNDLIINAYKPRTEFEQKFWKKAGENLECDFIDEHLKHLPVEPNIERSEKMLYSKLLSYYINNNYEIKLNAKKFYEILRDNFKLIDDYWFLDKQIVEYEEWKKDKGLKSIEEISKKQLILFVSDEKSAIIWLYNFIKTSRSYSEILTAYNQVTTNIEDEIPELRELLNTNFIFENGLYRRPATDKEIIEKQEKNEKELLKFFDKILLQARSSSKKIKFVRKEAIKLGFTKAYQEKRFEDILTVAKKLDKDILESNSEINDFVEIANIKVGDS